MLPFMKRFHSVGDLYLRVKWTMPANWQNSLSAADYLKRRCLSAAGQRRSCRHGAIRIQAE